MSMPKPPPPLSPRLAEIYKLPEGWPNQSMAELIGQGIVHPDALWDE